MKEQIDQMIENWLFNTLGADSEDEGVETQPITQRFEVSTNDWEG